MENLMEAKGNAEASENTKAEPKYQTKSLVDLLASTPPGAWYKVPDLGKETAYSQRVLNNPSLQLHCSSETCSGVRFFDSRADAIMLDGLQNIFLPYTCRNCGVTSKTFALKALTQRLSDGTHECLVVKIGELPAFGPPTPSRVISLIGPDRELFLKGRRAEILGLGIGAFSYYRRVVENQKGRLVEAIEEVAERVGVDNETRAVFEQAKKETQFQRAIELTKAVIPQALLIQGQNPLPLLHNALGEGLHARSDEQCLELATAFVVLTELAERISQVLKDEREIREAVSRLLNRPASE
jgi:hypothetical protein